MKLNAQLYSVKEDCQEDFIGTLKAIKEMGYAGVEFAGYYNVEPTELKKVLDDLELEAVSAHVSLDLLINNLDEEIGTLKILGAKYIVCPYSEIRTLAETVRLAEVLSRIGNICKDHGLTLLYHNHAHEFIQEENRYLLDAFYEAVDSDAVKQEVDVYWVAYAGIDVYDYLAKHLKRNELIHLKQIESMESRINVEAGKGIIDFKKIIEMAPTARFIYEQESFEGSRLDEMKRSIEFIQGL